MNATYTPTLADLAYDSEYYLCYLISTEVDEAPGIEEQRQVVKDWLEELEETGNLYMAIRIIKQAGCYDLLPLWLQ